VIAAIALDLGSTSIKAGLLNREGALQHIVSESAPEIVSNGAHYESDAIAYLKTADRVIARCLSQSNSMPPLGLCSQRSSFLIWKAANGQPITPLISWQDTRGAASCEALRDYDPQIRELTGLRLTPYFFAPKLRVILQEFPHWRELLANGEYLVGTLDTFLIWNWTGGKQYVTDVSMAARTLLMGLQQQNWSPQLCQLFGIPCAILPQIIPSAGLAIQLNNGLILQASMGDQSAAFVASVGAEKKTALVNLGTGGFVMRDRVSNKAVKEDKKLEGYLRTLLYQDSALRTHVAIEGTLNSIAAALAPYPVGECSIDGLATSEIFCLAEPSGLGAPYFCNDFGIHFSKSVVCQSPNQIAILLLEGIIFRVARILEDFHRVSAIEQVYLSGGLSNLPCLQYGIAQCLPIDVYRLDQKEASLLGAGLLAGGVNNTGRAVEPIIIENDSHRLVEKYRGWKIWLDELLTQRIH
jgi:glycerol kinase